MSLKLYLFFMTVGTVISAIALAMVAYTVNPQTTNWLGFTLFYASLVLTITGTAAIIGFIIRFVALKKELAHRLVIASFRQGFLLAIFLNVLLYLFAHNLFNWLNAAALILFLSIIEFLFLNSEKPHEAV